MVIEEGKHYKTKNGFPVLIHNYQGKGTFSIKGSIYKKHRGRHNNPRYEIWQPNGMNRAIEACEWDLVEICTAEINDLFERRK